jgi:uncharacterized protein YerC
MPTSNSASRASSFRRSPSITERHTQASHTTQQESQRRQLSNLARQSSTNSHITSVFGENTSRQRRGLGSLFRRTTQDTPSASQDSLAHVPSSNPSRKKWHNPIGTGKRFEDAKLAQMAAITDYQAKYAATFKLPTAEEITQIQDAHANTREALQQYQNARGAQLAQQEAYKNKANTTGLDSTTTLALKRSQNKVYDSFVDALFFSCNQDENLAQRKLSAMLGSLGYAGADIKNHSDEQKTAICDLLSGLVHGNNKIRMVMGHTAMHSDDAQFKNFLIGLGFNVSLDLSKNTEELQNKKHSHFNGLPTAAFMAVGVAAGLSVGAMAGGIPFDDFNEKLFGILASGITGLSTGLGATVDTSIANKANINKIKNITSNTDAIRHLTHNPDDISMSIYHNKKDSLDAVRESMKTASINTNDDTGGASTDVRA